MDQSLRPIPLGNEKAGLILGAVSISRGYQLSKLRRANNREGWIETRSKRSRAARLTGVGPPSNFVRKRLW